jgi:hypothetical protein
VSCSSSLSDSRNWWRASCISLPRHGERPPRRLSALEENRHDDLPSATIVPVADAARIRNCHPRPCRSHASFNAGRRRRIAADRPPADRRRPRADGAKLTLLDQDASPRPWGRAGRSRTIELGRPVGASEEDRRRPASAAAGSLLVRTGIVLARPRRPSRASDGFPDYSSVAATDDRVAIRV